MRKNDMTESFFDETFSLALQSKNQNTPQASIELAMRALIRDYTHRDITPAPADYLKLCKSGMMSNENFLDNIFDSREDFEKQVEQRGFAQLVLRRTSDAIFGITTTGRFGMFPHISLPGDCVFMIHGGVKTFLVRRHPERDVYTWLGEGYVYDLDEQIKEVTTSSEPTCVSLV
ncbi:hypothetical protein MMC18_009654 [Xylographa bjoerkii]|nr:hypothetical protein [Xylographa bjoerkii]